MQFRNAIESSGPGGRQIRSTIRTETRSSCSNLRRSGPGGLTEDGQRRGRAPAEPRPEAMRPGRRATWTPPRSARTPGPRPRRPTGQHRGDLPRRVTEKEHRRRLDDVMHAMLRRDGSARDVDATVTPVRQSRTDRRGHAAAEGWHQRQRGRENRPTVNPPPLPPPHRLSPQRHRRHSEQQERRSEEVIGFTAEIDVHRLPRNQRQYRGSAGPARPTPHDSARDRQRPNHGRRACCVKTRGPTALSAAAAVGSSRGSSLLSRSCESSLTMPRTLRMPAVRTHLRSSGNARIPHRIGVAARRSQLRGRRDCRSRRRADSAPV